MITIFTHTHKACRQLRQKYIVNENCGNPFPNSHHSRHLFSDYIKSSLSLPSNPLPISHQPSPSSLILPHTQPHPTTTSSLPNAPTMSSDPIDHNDNNTPERPLTNSTQKAPPQATSAQIGWEYEITYPFCPHCNPDWEVSIEDDRTLRPRGTGAHLKKAEDEGAGELEKAMTWPNWY